MIEHKTRPYLKIYSISLSDTFLDLFDGILGVPFENVEMPNTFLAEEWTSNSSVESEGGPRY
jgi:hypothetical protein